MMRPELALPNAETITHAQLENGITVLIYENHNVESVVLQGSLRAGSIYDAAAMNGRASMTAAALMRGTSARDFDQLHSDLEDIGADFYYSTGKFRVDFGGKALAEDFVTLVDVFNDSLRHPTFPAEELIEEQRKRLTELNYAQHNTRYMSSRIFREALYPPVHPFHYSTYGSLDTLPRISRHDLQAFHREQYGPDEMIIVVVGAVNTQETLAVLADALADWHNPQQRPTPQLPPVRAPQALQLVASSIPGKTQTDVVLGTIGPSRTAPAYRAASLVNSILGEFGMMGRVGHVIREELGLAYYAYSRLEAGQGPGTWHITIGVAPEDVELAIEKARKEIQRIISEPLSAEDLADNQSYFSGRLPLRLESSTGLASAIHAMARFDLGLDYLMNYHDEIYSLSREDLLATAQHYLNPDALVIAIAGPD